MAKLLYLEDDEEIAKQVCEWLKNEGHVVEHFTNGDDAWQCLQAYQYDLVLLDWQVPGMSGAEICSRYRRSGGSTWMILLTGKTLVSDKESGLDSGADDYLTKPFDLRELSARLRSALRRGNRTFADGLAFGDVSLDPATRVLVVGETKIKLTKLESALLEFLMRNPKRLFAAKDIHTSVWPADSDSGEASVRTCVYGLRKKFEAANKPDFLKTSLKEGYYVDPED